MLLESRGCWPVSDHIAFHAKSCRLAYFLWWTVYSLFDEPFTYFGLERKPTSSEVVWASFLSVSSLIGAVLNENSETQELSF